MSVYICSIKYGLEAKFKSLYSTKRRGVTGLIEVLILACHDVT